MPKKEDRPTFERVKAPFHGGEGLRNHPDDSSAARRSWAARQGSGAFEGLGMHPDEAKAEYIKNGSVPSRGIRR